MRRRTLEEKLEAIRLVEEGNSPRSVSDRLHIGHHQIYEWLYIIIQSMSRKGNCLDNSVMENFFGIMKSELLYAKKYTSMDCFITNLKEYMEYYNNERIKLRLNGMSPVLYRKAFEQAHSY